MKTRLKMAMKKNNKKTKISFLW